MNFRRWITALAVLALFAGLASAQVANTNAGAGPFTCSASVSVPPTLRAEGLTELVGDIVLTCTGGGVVAPGTSLASNTANFTVSFGTNVTSRLLPYSMGSPNTLTASNTSEALLLIDEPGSTDPAAVPGWGPQAPQILCGTGGYPFSSVGAGVGGGCPEYVGLSGGNNVMAAQASGTLTPGANVFSGVWGGSGAPNQVTFYGIPIMPPTSAGAERVYRMTNIRINANTLAGGILAGTTQVWAYISISGNTSVPINNANLVAGSVQPGLTVNLRSGTNGSFSSINKPQCSGSSASSAPGDSLAVLRYTENFGTSFKARTSLGYAIPTNQNVPGTIYNSESGLIPYGPGGPLVTGMNYSNQVGLSDYGTRLKVVFNNVPSTMRIFVSTVNVAAGTLVPVLAPSATGASYAQLVISETATDGNGSPPFVPNGGLTGTTPYAEIIASGGMASAVWEVVSTNPATLENFDFQVFLLYSGSPGGNTPPPGAATINMSFAPIPTQGAFGTYTPGMIPLPGSSSSSTLPLPRFADSSGSGVTLFSVYQCTTSLLFPFITNQAGFDTGVAIMNTTSDPFATKAQAGTCAFNWYGQNAPPVYTTGIIPSGNNTAASTYAFLASSIAPNFQGYMIAVCNFQLAHGYAFVSDLGAQKLAHGYLALVFGPNTPTATSRGNANPEMLEN